MRRSLIFFGLLILAASWVAIAPDEDEPKPEPYTVVDYFLMLPQDLLPLDAAERVKALKSDGVQPAWEFYDAGHYTAERSDEHDYLRVTTAGDGSGTIYTLKVIRRKEGLPVLAFHKEDWAMCCEDGDLWLLTFDNKEWQDVTNLVLEEPITPLQFYPEDMMKQVIDRTGGEGGYYICRIEPENDTIKVMRSEGGLVYDLDQDPDFMSKVWDSAHTLRLDLLLIEDRLKVVSRSK